MTSADPKHNYYADLGVSPNAEETEIRKAFRQLALKFHPDRNPGRETEFVKVFQNIQAAHEILSDSTQRAKYDAERRKYRGINNPTSGSGPNTPRSRAPPPPQRPHYTTTPSGSYYRAPPPRPTPQRPPPPQQHATYTNGADRFAKNFRPPPTAQQPYARPTDKEARANVFTAWQKMKQPRADDPRAQNPPPPPPPPPPSGARPDGVPFGASAHNPNGVPFGRSGSTRTPSKKGFDPCTPGGDEGQARSSYRSTYERPVPSPPQTADPLKHFKEQEDHIPHVPFSEANRVRTPYSSKTGERTSMFTDTAGLGRSASVRNSPTHRNGTAAESGSFSDSGRKQRNSFAGMKSTPFPHMYVSSSEDESEQETFRPAHPKRSGVPPKGPAFGQHSKPASSPFNPAPAGTPPDPRHDGIPANFKSKSEESINMKFSPSDWGGTFQGSPDYFAPKVPKAPKLQKRTSSKGRTSPSRGRNAHRGASDRNPFAPSTQTAPPPAPFPPPQGSHMPPPPPPMPPPPPLNTRPAFPSPSASGSAPQSATTFTQEEWAEQFKEPSWAFPPSTKEMSPRRGSTATKRPKPASRKASVPQNATNGSAQPEGPKAKYQASAQDDSSDDDDAMDIDTATPTPPAEQSRRLSVGADQTYKPGNPIKFSPASRTAPSSPQRQHTGRGRAGTVPSGGGAASPSPAPDKRSTSGLEGLAGLKNVEPFAPSTNGGLAGLSDLSASLPFKSAPSTSHPTKPSTAQKLRYPDVPMAPAIPPVLDEASTKAYLAAMGHYCKKYREYAKTMTGHFAARDAQLEDLDEGFALQRGEGVHKVGFVSYMRGLEEDERTLETWRVAQEMHRKAMRGCEEVRNRTVRLVG